MCEELGRSPVTIESGTVRAAAVSFGANEEAEWCAPTDLDWPQLRPGKPSCLARKVSRKTR